MFLCTETVCRMVKLRQIAQLKPHVNADSDVFSNMEGFVPFPNIV